MIDGEANILFQSEHHPLVADSFETLEGHCLSLIHRCAYEAAASLAEGKRVLDVGCNNGYGTKIISEIAQDIVGVDVSSRAIDAAQARYTGVGIHFDVIDGRRLPFDDGSFELVVSFQVIEHIDDVRPYLEEITRVLTAGGEAVFTTPNRAIRLDPGMKPWNEFHVREYSAAEIEAELGVHFAEVHVRGLMASPEFYAVEYERVQRALRRARRLSAQVPHPKIRCRARRVLRTAVSTALPGPLVDWLKRVRRRVLGASAPPADGSKPNFERFGSADLSYQDEALDQALDLMAICTGR